MFAIPMGMLIDGAFLMCWKFLLPRVPTHWPRTKQVLFAVAVTLAAWLVMASCVAAFSVRVLNSPSSVGGAGVAATLLSALVGGIACFSPPEAPTGTNSVSTCMLLARSVCAACSIGIAVAIAAVSEVAGGIASTFPAIFFTTMVVSDGKQNASWHAVLWVEEASHDIFVVVPGLVDLSRRWRPTWSVVLHVGLFFSFATATATAVTMT